MYHALCDPAMLQIDPARRASTPEWVPRTDIFDLGHAYRITLDVPGLAESDVKVTVEERLLTVAGERPSPHGQEGVTVLRSERLHGRFSRRFRLPRGVQADKVEATVRDGVLEILLPRPDEALPHSIEVKKPE